MKIKLIKLIYMLIIISLIKFPFPHAFMSVFKIGVAFFSLLFIIRYHYFNIKKHFPILIFCAVIIVSSIFNYKFGIQSLYAILYAILIYEIFLYTDVWIKKYGIYDFTYKVFWLLLSLCLINDVILLGNFGIFFLGSKFTVSYYHLLMIMFWGSLIEDRKKISITILAEKIIFLILSVVSVIVAIYVDTRTGLVGICSYLLIFSASKFLKKILVSPICSCITIFIMGGTVFFWESILSIDFVKHIIVELLHRSLSLTGRLKIYKILIDIFKQKPILGWGYESSIVNTTLYGNAQNGLIHLAIQYGIIGVASFIFIIFWTVKKIDASQKVYLAILSAMYAFFVMSTVEIVYGNIFFIIIAILCALEKNGEFNQAKTG